MCGIIAFKGENGAKEIILEGLKHLEYRGYDFSWHLPFSKKRFIFN